MGRVLRSTSNERKNEDLPVLEKHTISLNPADHLQNTYLSSEESGDEQENTLYEREDEHTTAKTQDNNLNQTQNKENLKHNNNNNTNNNRSKISQNIPEEAIEAPLPKSQKQGSALSGSKKKRTVLEALGSDNGLSKLKDQMAKLHFKGPGNEADDIALVLYQYAKWAHESMPGIPFDEVVEQLELLSFSPYVRTLRKELEYPEDKQDGNDNNEKDSESMSTTAIERQGEDDSPSISSIHSSSGSLSYKNGENQNRNQEHSNTTLSSIKTKHQMYSNNSNFSRQQMRDDLEDALGSDEEEDHDEQVQYMDM